MTDLKAELESVILDNKIATPYREVDFLKKELISIHEEIDRLNQELINNNRDFKKTVEVNKTLSESRF